MKIVSIVVASALVLTTANVWAASGREDSIERLQSATDVLHSIQGTPDHSIPDSVLNAAKCIVVVPNLVKGGFIFGAEGGDGVLLRRTAHGWSTPKFYGMGSASFGLQAGLEQAELVFIINSDRALRGIEGGNFKLGANAGLTVVTLSAGAEGATTARGGDIVVWTSATGAYGGLSFNGSVIKADDDENATPATGPEAQALRKNLGSL